jgi:uncharacterized membrane protein YeaQ/YmgE (transglycosylase-associated protein family)
MNGGYFIAREIYGGPWWSGLLMGAFVGLVGAFLFKYMVDDMDGRR